MATSTEEAFYNWMAGFIDGEGCFGIRKMPLPKKQWCCYFKLAIRGDDRPILEEIVERTGVGYLTETRNMAGHGKPQSIWNVGSKDDCLKLIAILDSHPLRAKKARDYQHWRTAVLNWVEVSQGQRGFDWGIVEQCRDAMVAGRIYA